MNRIIKSERTVKALPHTSSEPANSILTLVLLSSEPLLLLLSVVATDKLTELLEPRCAPLTASNDMSSNDVLSSRSLCSHHIITDVNYLSFTITSSKTMQLSFYSQLLPNTSHSSFFFIFSRLINDLAASQMSIYKTQTTNSNIK